MACDEGMQVFWIRGVLTGEDYAINGDQFLTLTLVPRSAKAMIVVIPILFSLFIGGLSANIAFFTPVLIYPLLVELISCHRRKDLRKSIETGTFCAAVRTMRWSDIRQISFEGGLFMFSVEERNQKKKIIGFTSYSNVNKMINSIKSVSPIRDITVRQVDWIYAFSALFLAAFSLFILTSASILLGGVLLAFSTFLWVVFTIKLVRSKIQSIF